jgi:hypothetical protein
MTFHETHSSLVFVKLTSLACVVGPSVTMSLIDFSFQNLVFWNLFEFSMIENYHLKINISHNLNSNPTK